MANFVNERSPNFLNVSDAVQDSIHPKAARGRSGGWSFSLGGVPGKIVNLPFQGVAWLGSTAAYAAGGAAVNKGLDAAKGRLESMIVKDSHSALLQKFDVLFRVTGGDAGPLKGNEREEMLDNLRLQRGLAIAALLGALSSDSQLSGKMSAVLEALNKGDIESAHRLVGTIREKSPELDLRANNYLSEIELLLEREMNLVDRISGQRVGMDLEAQFAGSSLLLLEELHDSISSGEHEAWRVSFQQLSSRDFTPEEGGVLRELDAVASMLNNDKRTKALSKLDSITLDYHLMMLGDAMLKGDERRQEVVLSVLEELQETSSPLDKDAELLFGELRARVLAGESGQVTALARELMRAHAWSELERQALLSIINRDRSEVILFAELGKISANSGHPFQSSASVLQGLLKEQIDDELLTSIANLRRRDATGAVDGEKVNQLVPLLRNAQAKGVEIDQLPEELRAPMLQAYNSVAQRHLRSLEGGSVDSVMYAARQEALDGVSNDYLSMEQLEEIEKSHGVSLQSPRLRGLYYSEAVRIIKSQLYTAQGKVYLVQLDELTEQIQSDRKGSKRLLLQTVVDVLDGKNTVSENLRAVIAAEGKDLLTQPLYSLLEANRTRKMVELVDRVQQEIAEDSETTLTHNQEIIIGEALLAIKHGSVDVARQQVGALLGDATPKQSHYLRRILFAIDAGQKLNTPLVESVIAITQKGGQNMSVELHKVKVKVIKEDLQSDIDKLFEDASGLPTYPEQLKPVIKRVKRSIESARVEDAQEPRDVRFNAARNQLQRSQPVKIILSSYHESVYACLERLKQAVVKDRLDDSVYHQVHCCGLRYEAMLFDLEKAISKEDFSSVDELLVQLVATEKDLEVIQKLCGDGVGHTLELHLRELKKTQQNLRAISRMDRLLSRPPGSVELAFVDLIDDAYHGREVSSALSRLNHQVQARSEEFLLQSAVQTLTEEGLEGLWAKYFGSDAPPQVQSQLESIGRLLEYFKSNRGRDDLQSFLVLKALHIAAGESSLQLGDREELIRQQGIQFFLDLPEDHFNAMCDQVLDKWLSKIADAISTPKAQADYTPKASSKAEQLVSRLIQYGKEGGLAKATDKAFFAPLLTHINDCESESKSGLAAALDQVLKQIKPVGELGKEFEVARGEGRMPNLDELYEMIRSDEGLSSIGAFLFAAWNQTLDDSHRPPSRSQLERHLEVLKVELQRQGVSDEAEAAVQETVEAVIEVLDQKTTQADPAHFHFDISPFVCSDGAAVEGRSIVLVSFNSSREGIDLEIPEATLRLLIEVAVKRALVSGGSWFDSFNDLLFAGKDDASALLGSTLTQACKAVQGRVRDPGKPSEPIDHEAEAHNLGHLLMGPDFQALPFPPAVRLVLKTVLTPSAVGAIPFRIAGETPIGVKGLQAGTSYGVIDSLVKGALASPKLAQVLREKTKHGRDIYDITIGGAISGMGNWMFSSGKKEFTAEELEFRKACGEAAFHVAQNMFVHEPDVLKAIEGVRRNFPGLWQEIVSDLVWDSMKEVVCDALNIPVHALTITDLKRFVLTATAEGIAKQRVKLKKVDAAKTAKEQHELLQELEAEETKKLNAIDSNLALIAKVVSPLRSHTSIPGLAIGLIPHAINRLVIQKVAAVSKWIFKGLFRLAGRKFKGSVVHGFYHSRDAYYNASGRMYRTQLNESLIQNQGLVNDIYHKVIKGGALNYLQKHQSSYERILRVSKQLTESVAQTEHLLSEAEDLSLQGLTDQSRKNAQQALQKAEDARYRWEQLLEEAALLHPERSGYVGEDRLLKAMKRELLRSRERLDLAIQASNRARLILGSLEG